MEGETFDFGYLVANSTNVNSGDTGFFNTDINQSVMQGTVETTYNNEQKYSFKWAPNSNINISGNPNYYSSLLNFEVASELQEKRITRNFHTVYPLTIKNLLPENGNISVDSILFKDPTTDNQFHPYSAASGGFVKNEAFENLSIQIGQLQNQKYAVKAYSSFNYGGRNYYWYNGDFNPTSQTDLLITAPTTKTATYKGTQLSNNSNAFANNGQRKFIRTNDGNLHLVYESMGHVWYERSTDNGSTWILANGGKPLDSNGGKLPAIDNHGNDVSIVWEENDGSGAVKIQVACFGGLTPYNGYPKNVFWDNNQSYSNNLNPVIAYDYDGRGIIAWENKVNNIYSIGIVAKYGPLGQFAFFGNPYWGGWDTKVIPSTNANSVYPSITSNEDPDDIYNMIYYFVWQQGNSSVKYCTLSIDGYENINVSSIETPSSGSPSFNNSQPSISLYSSSKYPVIAWMALQPAVYRPTPHLRIKFSSGWSQFYVYHYGGMFDLWDVNTVNINSNSDGKFVLAWGGDGDYDQYITSYSSSNIYNLSSKGDVQVSNAGTNMSDMKINSFDRYSSVKDFTTLAVTNGIYKSAAENEEIVSRGLVLTKDSSVYIFDIGAIEVDGKRILFSGNNSFEPDSAITDKNEFETEPFLLTDNSNFSFKTDYYSKLSKNDDDLSVKFKIELIDSESGKVIEVLGEENRKDHYYKDRGYTVNTNGIGNREVKMRLAFSANGTNKTNENLNTELFTSVVNNSEKINKENYQQIALKKSEIVKDYALFQNYPNPFNPSTIISYQLPKDGFVILKIYDMLGREVKTLVNEFKTKGRYQVNFSAGNELASGVYFYQLTINNGQSTSNNFSSIKKFILLR